MSRGRIRPARRDEVPDLQAIEVAAGAAFRELGMDAVADDPPPSAEVLAGGRDRGGLWVLEDGGAVVAYLLDDVVDGDAHLEQVSVHPRAARRGHGAQLVEDLARRAREAGRSALTLTTYTDVPWNAPYYARLGFRPVADDELGPELRAVRRTEVARGLDRWPRTAMRRDVGPVTGRRGG
ncbi:GNAT family N-acetyltransferase [Actinomycetospora cinnamomea]|uniref:N-acetylglutamate synthase-like GNAT family acetyltransferase n=1 Tax=Actinomycetospora cinnamomea TaxID=663609 RepID=A0A2U1FQB9_9PSEU|nr:GNAT family N-acetyltransferase [Actinomycetospora cinnamomea]PVZ14344.1 N-acetylglutamate synthase-like GNAT family acetyltransferase [Actinomycetospora cinnamomea]